MDLFLNLYLKEFIVCEMPLSHPEIFYVDIYIYVSYLGFYVMEDQTIVELNSSDLFRHPLSAMVCHSQEIYVYICIYIYGCLQNELVQIEAYSANPTYKAKAFQVPWPSSLPKYFNRNEVP